MRPIQSMFAVALLTIMPLLSPPLAQAAMATSGQREVINRFIDYSSYATQFEALPQMVQKQLESSFGQGTASARYKELTTLLLDAFEADRARHAMIQQLSLGYDNSRYRALLQRLENPVIRKLRDMELAIHGPVARYEIRDFISRLPQNPAPAKRETLIRELLTASGAVENTLRTHATLNEVVRGLVTSPAAGTERNPMNDSLEQSQTLTKSLRPGVEAERLAVALYTYRDASDEEIRKYIDFYNSPAGQWFNQTQQNGWLGALRNIGRDVAWKMQHAGSSDDVQTAFEDELGL